MTVQIRFVALTVVSISWCACQGPDTLTVGEARIAWESGSESNCDSVALAWHGDQGLAVWQDLDVATRTIGVVRIAQDGAPIGDVGSVGEFPGEILYEVLDAVPAADDGWAVFWMSTNGVVHMSRLEADGQPGDDVILVGGYPEARGRTIVEADRVLIAGLAGEGRTGLSSYDPSGQRTSTVDFEIESFSGVALASGNHYLVVGTDGDGCAQAVSFVGSELSASAPLELGCDPGLAAEHHLAYAGDGIFQSSTVFTETTIEPDGSAANAAVAQRHTLLVDEDGTISLSEQGQRIAVTTGEAAFAGVGAFTARLVTQFSEESSDVGLEVFSDDGLFEETARLVLSPGTFSPSYAAPAVVATGPQSWLVAYAGDNRLKIHRVTLE